jgi:hypothetical protein
MNANTTTRETARAGNALDALEAALSAYLSADKAKDDAFSIVRKTCPVDKNTHHYDTAHPAYQPLHDARKHLDEARDRYYAEYTATVNTAAQRGDAETFWLALDFIIDRPTPISLNPDHYDNINWTTVEAMGNKLYDCDSFRHFSTQLTNIYAPSGMNVVNRTISHLADNNMLEFAYQITERAASIVVNIKNGEQVIAKARTAFADMCARTYLMDAGTAGSNAGTIGSIVAASEADRAGAFITQAGCYFLNTRSVDDLTRAAAKWRNIINIGDSDAQSHVAQFAHMTITVTLLINHNTITADDLATLINTLQEYEDTHPDRDTHAIILYDPKDDSRQIFNVGELIDYAGSRMSIN